jgi:hypothetical protein
MPTEVAARGRSSVPRKAPVQETAVQNVGRALARRARHLASTTAHGSAFKEGVIKSVAYSSAPTGLISLALILWGLRIGANKEASS